MIGADTCEISTVCGLSVSNNYCTRRRSRGETRSWTKACVLCESHTSFAQGCNWRRYLGSLQSCVTTNGCVECGEDTTPPVPGPLVPHKVLWAFTDARDAAQAFRMAVKNDQIVHEVYLIHGDDTCSLVETGQLIGRYFPSVHLKKIWMVTFLSGSTRNQLECLGVEK